MVPGARVGGARGDRSPSMAGVPYGTVGRGMSVCLSVSVGVCVCAGVSVRACACVGARVGACVCVCVCGGYERPGGY